MRWNWMVVAFCFVLSVPFSTWAGTVYSTVLVEDPKITLDGDLSDWEKLRLKGATIEYFVLGHRIRDAEDLSGRFRCFVDRDHLYVGVEVTDDEVIFGTELFALGWLDDSVEICFDGDLVDIEKGHFDLNDGQIQVIPHGDGGVHFSGGGLSLKFGHHRAFPYMWELLGVEGAVKQTDTGYSVEVRIPREVLGVEAFSSGSRFGLNVRILDDDDGGGRDHLVSWTEDEGDRSWRSAERFGQVEVRGLVGGSSELMVEKVDVEGGPKELVVTVAPRNGLEVRAVAGLISEGKEAEAQVRLEGLVQRSAQDKEKMWAFSVLGGWYSNAGEHAKSIQAWEGVVGLSPPGAVSAYVLQKMALAYDALGESEKAMACYERIVAVVDADSWTAADAVVQIAALEGPERAREVCEKAFGGQESPRLLMKFGNLWRERGNYPRAREEYRKVISHYPDSEYANWAQRLVRYLPEDEGDWAVVAEVEGMVEAGRYKEAATLYKERLDHLEEGHNARLIIHLVDMFRRRGVFKKVMIRFLELQEVQR